MNPVPGLQTGTMIRSVDVVAVTAGAYVCIAE